MLATRGYKKHVLASSSAHKLLTFVVKTLASASP